MRQDPDSGIVRDADEEIRKSSLPQPSKSKPVKPVYFHTLYIVNMRYI